MENNRSIIFGDICPHIKFWLVSQVKKFQGGGRTDLKFQLNMLLVKILNTSSCLKSYSQSIRLMRGRLRPDAFNNLSIVNKDQTRTESSPNNLTNPGRMHTHVLTRAHTENCSPHEGVSYKTH